eukprot:g3633.t1
MKPNNLSIAELKHILEGTAEPGPTPALSKEEAILQLWSLAYISNENKLDILKEGCSTILCESLENGTIVERYAAAGCFATLVECEESLTELFKTCSIDKASKHCKQNTDHIRSKIPVARFFKILARNEAYREAAKRAFPGLLRTVELEGYKWAKLTAAQADAISALHVMLTDKSSNWTDTELIETFLSKSVLESLSYLTMHGNALVSTCAVEILVHLTVAYPTHVVETLGSLTLQNLLKSSIFVVEEVKLTLISFMHAASSTSIGREALGEESYIAIVTGVIQEKSKHALKKGKEVINHEKVVLRF